MLPDLSCEKEHSELYCACLEGMTQEEVRDRVVVGGRHEHDTERSHGGCDGKGMEPGSNARHPQWMVGWLVGRGRKPGRQGVCTYDRPEVTMVQPNQGKYLNFFGEKITKGKVKWEKVQ